MSRKVLSFISVLFLITGLIFAQEAEDEGDWYYGHDISKIEFEGLKNVKKADLAGIISAYEDEPFSDEVYGDLLDRLYSLDLFEEINPYAKHDPKDPDKVLLVFQVVERPVIKSIVFEGNKKLRNGELRDKIKMKSSDVFVESKVLMDERILRNYYIEKGYTNSTVTHTVEKKDDGVIITFKINEGANTVIKAIHFSGNTIVSEKVLKSKLQLKEAGFLKDGAYQVATLEQDKLTVRNYYTERGYVDVNIQDVKIETELNTEKNRNEITITYILQEGAQYIFTGLTVTGNEVFSLEKILELNKLKEGTVYNETKFQEAIADIANLYYENGYMSAGFYPVPTKDTERHEISYKLTIVESSRSHIENIIIKGNGKTKEYVIRREIPIQPGDVFSRDKIINGLRNLMNLQYFSNVIPEPQQGSEPGLIDLVFTVEEQSTTNLQAGATFSGVTDPNEVPISIYGKFMNSNLFGEGKTISTSLNISTTEKTLDFEYSQNWIGNQPIAFYQNLSISKADTSTRVNMFLPNMDLNQQYYYMNYTGYAVSLGTGFARRWTPDFAILSLGLGISNSLRNNVYDETTFVPVDQSVSAYANRWGIVNSVYTSFSVDHRDINYDPSKGWFASERIAWYGLIPNVEKEFFLRSDTKLEGYLKLCDIPLTDKYNFKVVLAGIAGFSALFPVNSTITEQNRLYIDGMFNARGWTEIYRMRNGQAMFSSNVELRIPIVPNVIGFDAFWDAAAVKDTIQNVSTLCLEDFYFSFGPGLRFLIPQFPIHFVFSFRYRIQNSQVVWNKNPFQFVLSFNLVNR